MNNFNNNLNKLNEGTNKVPSCVLRKCCACGKIADRNEFIRILTDSKTAEIIINPNNKQFGRSQYLCKNKECLKLGIKKKRLKHLSEKDIEKLKEILNN